MNGTDTVTNWQPYWRAAARAVKRAVLSRQRVNIAGHQYLVAYEARGEQAEDDTGFLAELSRGKQCVVDVGANVGITALAMISSMASSGAVWAIDPSEANCLVIHENAALNHLNDRIRVVNALVGDTSGQVGTFYWSFVNITASMKIKRGPAIPLQKPTIAIDDLVRTMNVAPQMFKVDVEGAEAEVVTGMRETLSQHRPVVYVEVHGWPETSLKENLGRILSNLQGTGYRAVHLSTGSTINDESMFSHVPTDRLTRTFIVLAPPETSLTLPHFFHRDDAVQKA